MRAALRTLPSTYEVGFNVDRDEVYVSYDATASVDVKAMAKVVEAKAGFKAWVHAEKWPAVEMIDELRPLPR